MLKKFGFRILHRLDYSTSGVIVFPLNKLACAEGKKIKKMIDRCFLPAC
jgi:23S rRNA-/tRNA-specific pseudouridylate synthase